MIVLISWGPLCLTNCLLQGLSLLHSVDRFCLEYVCDLDFKIKQLHTDNYSKHKNLRFDLNNIFLTYMINNMNEAQIIKNWLGMQGLQFIKFLSQSRKITKQWKVYLKHFVENSNSNTIKPSFHCNIASLAGYMMRMQMSGQVDLE